MLNRLDQSPGSAIDRQRPYLYTAFGLTISSVIPLPELPLTTNAPDIRICRGKVESTLDDATSHIGFMQTSANATSLDLVDYCGARFLIRNGSEIVVDIHDDSQTDEQRLAILGYCFTALLFQRNHVVLHANAVSIEYSSRANNSRDNGAIAICGEPGAGKSTLTAALLSRQHQILADDVTAIDISQESNMPTVISGYPRLKLWADTLDYLGESTKGLHQVLPEKNKYSFPIEQSFQPEARSLRTIYILSTAAIKEPLLSEDHGIQKLAAIIKQVRSYLPEQLPQGQSWLFQKCAYIAEQTRVMRLQRPINGDSIEAVADLVEAHLLQT